MLLEVLEDDSQLWKVLKMIQVSSHLRHVDTHAMQLTSGLLQDIML